MSAKKKIFVSCEEANHFCDKNQYREATLREKLLLNIHLIYCRACRKYSANNVKLRKLIKKANIFTLDASTKAQMQEELEIKLREETR